MKTKNIFSIGVLCLAMMLAYVTNGKIRFGAKGMTITGGMAVALDSLVLKPVSNFTFESNTLTKSFVPVSIDGTSGIKSVYTFGRPIINYSGAVGIKYINTQLNGSNWTWLVIAISGNDTNWLCRRNNFGSIANYVHTGTANLINDTLFKVTAISGANYFSKSTGYLNNLATWGTNIDGSGDTPPDFNNRLNYFVISNRTGTIDLSNNWNLKGTLLLGYALTLNLNRHSINCNSIICDGHIKCDTESSLTISGNVSQLRVDSIWNTIGNLTLDSGAKVLLGDTLKITGGVNAGSVCVGTNAILNTNGKLVLKSDSSGTARIGIVSGRVTGDVKCMQYVRGGRRAYRFWAHPFNRYIPLSQLTNYIDITGVDGSANGFTPTTTNAPSCYWYNTLVGNSTSSYDPGWKPFNSCYGIADTDKFNRYEGIRLYIRGVKGQGLGSYIPPPSPVTIGMWGQINQGNQTVLLSKGTDTTKDYNMVGNPYASPTDIGTVVFNAKSAGLIRGTAFYVWNPYRGTAGGFEPKTIGGSYVLQAYNCFQVRAAVNGGTLNFTENNKASAAAQTLLKCEERYTALQIYDTNYHPWDITYLGFSNDATEQEDDAYDAGKFCNPDMNFYSRTKDGQMLSIDTRPYKEMGEIKLGVQLNYMQPYIIRADQLVLPDGGRLTLFDKYLNRKIKLEQGTEYRFEVTEDSASQGDSRFVLLMGDIPDTARKQLGVTVYPNPASDEITMRLNSPYNENITMKLVNAAGVSILQKSIEVLQMGNIKLDLKQIPDGIYLVEVLSKAGKVTTKFVKNNL